MMVGRWHALGRHAGILDVTKPRFSVGACVPLVQGVFESPGLSTCGNFSTVLNCCGMFFNTTVPPGWGVRGSGVWLLVSGVWCLVSGELFAGLCFPNPVETHWVSLGLFFEALYAFRGLTSGEQKAGSARLLGRVVGCCAGTQRRPGRGGVFPGKSPCVGAARSAAVTKNPPSC